MHSDYLKPQQTISLPFEIIKRKRFYREQKNIFDTISSGKPPSGWDAFIDKNKFEKVNGIEESTYTWVQCGQTITISLASQENNIQITNTEIHCSSISGTWTHPIFNFTISNNKEIIINISDPSSSSTTEWPCLIRGGDCIDATSAYYLGEISISQEFFHYWMIKSAQQHFKPACKSLAFSYLNEELFESSIYWFLRDCLDDPFSRIFVGQFFMEANDDNYDPQLAENIFVQNCIDGIDSAFYYLGYMHVHKLENFIQDNELGVRYLEESIHRTDDPVAYELLSMCLANGVGCQKDLDKARYYAQKALTLKEENESEEKKLIQPNKKEVDFNFFQDDFPNNEIVDNANKAIAKTKTVFAIAGSATVIGITAAIFHHFYHKK